MIPKFREKGTQVMEVEAKLPRIFQTSPSFTREVPKSGGKIESYSS